MRELGPSLVVRLENFLGAELLRAKLLCAAFPSLAGRYEIRGILGRGASGVVVRATDFRLEREVALKLVPVAGQADEVLGEARTLAKLEHRHIVPVYDVELVDAVIGGESFRVAYVSMRLVEGGTMRVWLAAERRDAAAILEKYVGAGSALAAAHRAGVLHRDFKPDNVMVDSVGHAYVVDFGLAAHAAGSTSTVGSSEGHGTFPYMAPEALAGRATRASDQYALAASIDESLSGLKVAASVRNAIERALRSDPERRFDSVDAFLHGLAPRRRWLRAVGLALTALTMGVGLTVLAGRGTVVEGGETSDAASPGARDVCGQLPLEWDFVTTVDSVDSGAVELGSQGRYRASFQRQQGCAFVVDLSRTSDRHAGTRGWPENRPVRSGESPVILADSSNRALTGEFVVALQRDSPQGLPAGPSSSSARPVEHAFRLRFTGDRLRGEFSVSSSDGPYSGTLEGRASAPGENRHER